MEFIKELFNKLAVDTDDFGNKVITGDGIECVNEEDLIDYFKNTIVSNLEWDTHYYVNNDELFKILLSIVSSMAKGKGALEIAKSDAIMSETLDLFANAQVVRDSLSSLNNIEKYSDKDLTAFIQTAHDLWEDADNELSKDFYINCLVDIVNKKKLPLSEVAYGDYFRLENIIASDYLD